MRMSQFRRVALSLAGLSLLVSGHAVSGESKYGSYAWNAALNVSEDNLPYIVTAEFARLLEERSGGSITVTLYPNGQLGNDFEQCEGVIAGNIDISSSNPSTMVTLVPKAAIFDLHNIFANIDHVRKTIDGPFLPVIQDVYAEKGIRILGFSDVGLRKLMSNKKIEKPEDLYGQKIRVMENKHQIAYWKSLGANPTPMDWGEVYIGLQQGTIDANEQPYEFVVSSKLYEVQKYLVDNSDHLMQYVVLIMNRDLYNSLPPVDKELVDQCAKDACAYGREQTDKRTAEKRQVCIDKGMELITWSPEVKAAIYEKSIPARDTVREAVGDELFDFYMECVKQAE